MSDTNEINQPTGLHTPVTNQVQEAGDITIYPVSIPPSPGENAKFPATLGDKETLPLDNSNENAEMTQVWIPPTSETLKDIGEASFGPLPQDTKETIHGGDNRKRIENTGEYPWRVHASLLITAADGSGWVGTAWFIGPHTLATAGHCVYIKNSNTPGRDGWVQSIKVMPGRNGNVLPFDFVTATKFYSVRGWAENGDPNYDYGVIIIPKDLGTETGYFGLGVYTDENLENVTLNISGYPGDKPDGTQWYDTNTVASVDASKVYYDIDTIGGQSGAAVYRIIDDKQFAVAIHAYGGATFNSGTRITNPVFTNLNNWKK